MTTVPADLDRRFRDSAGASGLLDVAYDLVDSPFGQLLVASSERGLCRISFDPEPERELEALARAFGTRVLRSPRGVDLVRRELDEYFEGRRRDFELSLDWRLTRGFQNRAQHAIARIPYGETRTYRWIAEKAGNARAFRAAGTACGANPLPPIVPCHRVVPAGGGVGSYGGGPEMKRALLRLESALPD